MDRVIVAAAVISLHLGIAYAREGDGHSKSPLAGWFSGLKSERGPCCSDADGDVVLDSDWTVKDGHYRVFVAQEWVDVPDSAVIKEPNLDGRTIVWPLYIDGRPQIRCFIPGSMT